MPITYKDDAIVQTAIGLGPQGEPFGIFAGSSNPWDAITEAPQYSRYYQTDGRVWTKAGAGYTSGDWSMEGSGDDTEIEYEESEGESARTFTSYQEKVSLTFTAEATDYWISANAEVASFASGARVAVRCRIDDTTTILDADPTPDGSDYQGWATVSTLYRATLSAGPRTIDMDYASTSSGKEVRIRRARITATKVS